jgi:hypothetical protein
MWWRTRGAATWTWTDEHGPSHLRAELAARGYTVCRFDVRAAAEDPWRLAARLLAARPQMVERQPIHPVPGGRSFASTAGDTPLHSDSQRFAGRPPHVQAMLCTRAARRGGATTLLDTRALLEEISIDDPALHADLHRRERTIPFVSGPLIGPTVVRDHDHTWFTHSPSPPRDEIGERLAPWLRRAAPISVTLAPGELLIVDNHRMLHGRTAFTGPRAFVRLLIWPAISATPARRRLDLVLAMLGGAAPGALAAREQLDEPDLYRWRDRALAAALAALEDDE